VQVQTIPSSCLVLREVTEALGIYCVSPARKWLLCFLIRRFRYLQLTVSWGRAKSSRPTLEAFSTALAPALAMLAPTHTATATHPHPHRITLFPTYLTFSVAPAPCRSPGTASAASAYCALEASQCRKWFLATGASQAKKEKSTLVITARICPLVRAKVALRGYTWSHTREGPQQLRMHTDLPSR
jgi:hypothetical protein